MSGMTSGDPLGGDEPRRESPPPAAPEAPAAPPVSGSGYGQERVPPGAFAPRRSGEAAAREAVPAEWWQRAVAMIVDSVIITVAAAIVLGILGAILFGALALDSPGGAIGAILVIVLALIGVSIAALLYAPLFMDRTNGQTLGKRMMGCRVVRDDGRRVDFLWAAYREVLIKALLLGIVGSITAGIAYLVNYLWPLFDDRKRALHDIVVSSRVVKD